jgi:hypothetical protein
VAWVHGFVLLLLLGLPIVAFIAYWNWKQDQKRRALLMQWATNSGFSFAPEDDSWCARWTGTPFGDGDHRRARNVVVGRTDQWPFAAFDYSYQTHSTDSKGNTTTTTHRYVVASLQLPTYLPQLQVTPESFFTRIGNALGLDDIELESEDFNRAFRVHANDRKFASDVLSPRTMEALLRTPDISWRIEGSDIVSWREGRMSPATAMAMLAPMRTLIAGIPSFVWKDHS